MSCVIFCLWIRGDHVESLPIPQARPISQARLAVDLGALYTVDLGGPLKSKSAQGENAARTLRFHPLLKLTTQ
jgi:hypothetical protein